ncbi:thioredoxin fold domain-containing protein [Methanocella sp. MCL-LM]|uniref:thioredoxin fold domain-containing protein n=1 Tax=Methanocella sp. MCL-LM TaxID=3412035 RepID=UPI003C724D4C
MMEMTLKWLDNIDEAKDISRKTGKPILLFFHSEHCSGCKAMIDKTLPDKNVVLHAGHRFVPAMFEIGEQKNKDLIARHAIEWTPTFLVMDNNNMVGYRMIGYMPPEEFRAQLSYGEGQLAFQKGDYGKASECFDDAYKKHPKSDIASEAMYYAGVCKYKQSKDVNDLKNTYNSLKQSYPDSIWTRKASVWSG